MMKAVSAKALCLLIVCLGLNSFKLKAADTLRISIKQADSLFLKANFKLLASAMNIDAQKAQVIQAKLYPNPVFTADFNAYDPEHAQAFHVNNTSGQKAFQLEQLILLGGKRKAQIDLAKTNVKISELEFQQLMSQLKFQLHSGMYFLSQQYVLIHKYNKQLNLLDTILAAYDVQAKKGNIALKDVVRLKGFYLNLNNERAEILKHYFEELSNVQTILQNQQVIYPIVSDTDFTSFIKPINLDDLSTTALQNRADFLITQQDKLLAEQYVRYQKRLAVPDINLVTSYDQRGGAFQNQVNVGFSIPLPVWNRNQGNIKTAAFQLRQQEYDTESIKTRLLADVFNYYHLYNQSVIEYQKTEKLYNEDFEVSFKGISENFRKGNVSILEFVDFFEAYNNALTEISRVKVQLNTSAEQINLTTGKEIFN
jgi:cobalt-zinc-cadmium efflux system outer membrane protein